MGDPRAHPQRLALRYAPSALQAAAAALAARRADAWADPGTLKRAARGVT